MSEAAIENTQPVRMPKALGGVVAYVTVEGTRKAAEFYKQAFGAEEVFCYPPDEQGRTMHLHLYINGSSIMLCDPYPEYGHAYKGQEGYSLQIIAEDVDFWFDRTVKAGAEVVMPVEKMFWGARWGQVRDPFGVVWGIGEPTG